MASWAEVVAFSQPLSRDDVKPSDNDREVTFRVMSNLPVIIWDKEARKRRVVPMRWGFPDPEGLALEDKLAARYRGKRYSFGYPACPDLAFQRELFKALRPEEIGVHLTEGDMMEPEASVSALVFQHPDARYFGV